MTRVRGQCGTRVRAQSGTRVRGQCGTRVRGQCGTRVRAQSVTRVRAQSGTRVRAHNVTRVRAQCTAVLVRAQCGLETGAWSGPWAGLSASQLWPLFRLWESPSASSSGPKVAWPLALHTFSYGNPLWL